MDADYIGLNVAGAGSKEKLLFGACWSRRLQMLVLISSCLYCDLMLLLVCLQLLLWVGEKMQKVVAVTTHMEEIPKTKE